MHATFSSYLRLFASHHIGALIFFYYIYNQLTELIVTLNALARILLPYNGALSAHNTSRWVLILSGEKNMANIMINDLADSVDLDEQAMAGLTGGHGRSWRRRGHRAFHRRRYRRRYGWYRDRYHRGHRYRHRRRYRCHYGW